MQTSKRLLIPRLPEYRIVCEEVFSSQKITERGITSVAKPTIYINIQSLVSLIPLLTQYKSTKQEIKESGCHLVEFVSRIIKCKEPFDI